MAIDKSEKRSKKVLNKLRNKYRLVLIRDETFEERLSFRLSRMNVLLVTVASIVLLGGLFVAAIVFTPLKEYIPGYADNDIRLHAYHASIKADSLSRELDIKDQYIHNLQRVLTGEIRPDSINPSQAITNIPSQAQLEPSPSELLLREKVLAEESTRLTSGSDIRPVVSLSNTVLYPPLRGMVTSSFDLASAHFGVDIVSPNEDAVKAVMEGTVIMASWTYDTGYVIQVQHSNNIISVYKHNAVLLKQIGDRVAGGEAIAIVGDSGAFSDGPHLHFELWSAGRPVDPQTYLVFG